MNDILQAISTVGFPIVACGYLAWYQKSTMDTFRDTMERNTSMLERLYERLGEKEGE